MVAWIVMVLMSILLGLSGANSAAAHSDFEGSDPADASVLDGPLAAMTMRFAVGVRDPGGGFTARGTDARVVVARSSSVDGRVWDLVFDPVVTGDPVTITYDVIAEDGHRVNGEVKVTTPLVPPSATSPDGTLSSPISSDSGSVATSSPMPSGMEVETLRPREVAAWVDPVEHLGRLAALGGSLVGIGLLAFGWGPARRRRATPYPVVITGAFATVAVAAVAETLGLSERTGLSVTTLIGDSLGRSSLLRLVGAVGILVLLVGGSQQWWTLRRHVERRIIAGCASVVAVAPAFDGHAVSQGPRVLHLVADVVHVVATAIWVGAVVGLLVERGRSGGQVAAIVHRVSRLLTVTVAVVGVTGVAMTLMIVDGSWEWGSGWVRMLMVKVAFVALAGGIGWHHHRRVLTGDVVATPRSTLAVELVAFVGAVGATSWLVAAMP